MKVSFLLTALSISVMVYSQHQPLIFATYAYAENDRLGNIEPFVNFLSKNSGLPIKAVSYPTVHALLRAIQHDSVDFAMMNTTGYLVMQRFHPNKVSPLVNLEMSNGTTTNYGGCIIANKKTGIISIENLKTGTKKSLALVNVSSTSGNLLPRLLLNSHGITSAEEVLNVSFAGTHRQVMEVFSNFCNGWTEFKEAKQFRRVSDTDYNSFRAMFGSNIKLWALIK